MHSSINFIYYGDLLWLMLLLRPFGSLKGQGTFMQGIFQLGKQFSPLLSIKFVYGFI